MSAKFDIFMRHPDGHPIWVRAAETLDEAKRILREFAISTPGDYFIFDSRNGEIVMA